MTGLVGFIRTLDVTMRRPGAITTKRMYLGDRLLDLHNFRMDGNPENCRKSQASSKLLHIAVHSSRRNFNRRSAIRRTWGSVKRYKGWEIALNFLLGSPPCPERTQDKIITDVVKNETTLSGDVIVGNFVDTYRNLTYKHLMGYKWLLEFCPQVEVYIKTDDDVFVNIPKIVDWLSNNSLTTHFYCYVLRGYSPWRSRRYKFYISKDEYRPEKFPDYCSGVGYIATPGLLRKLYGVSMGVKYLWVEDLFATGLLPKYYNENSDRIHKGNEMGAQVQLRDMSELYLNEQYAVYKRWIDDENSVYNPWFFVLLETRDEHELVLDQESLWRKTMQAYKVDNVH